MMIVSCGDNAAKHSFLVALTDSLPASTTFWSGAITAPSSASRGEQPNFNLRLIAEHHVQQGTVNLNVAVVINKTQFPEFIHVKKLTRGRVVPIISASVSWLIFAIIGSADLPCQNSPEAEGSVPAVSRSN
jgi:hypothetical protein